MNQRANRPGQPGLSVLRIVALLALLAATPAAASGPGLDFELPGEAGFIRLSELPPMTTVVSFWRADCPPCLRELALLNRHAAAHPELRVITIALQSPGETLAAPVRPQAPVLSLHGPSRPEGLLARFGNRPGALPYTVALDSSRVACARHSGELDGAWLERARESCR